MLAVEEHEVVNGLGFSDFLEIGGVSQWDEEMGLAGFFVAILIALGIVLIMLWGAVMALARAGRFL